MMVKTCNKNVHPGHPNLRAWDNHPEHCHSRDQVIIVMIMTGNDHFPLLHSSRSKLFFIVSNILTFLHCVKYFQIYATWPYSRGHVWNPAVYGISQLPMIINYDQISSIMMTSCVQWWCSGLPEQGVTGLYFYKLHNQAKHPRQVKVQIQTHKKTIYKPNNSSQKFKNPCLVSWYVLAIKKCIPGSLFGSVMRRHCWSSGNLPTHLASTQTIRSRIIQI